MKVLIDMDGIVADLLGKWLRVYNDEYGANLCKEDVHCFDMNQAFPGHLNLVPIIFREKFFDDLEVIDGAQTGVQRIRDAGHDVRFCSAVCSDDSARAKLSWLRRYFDVSSKHVYLCNEKWDVLGDVLIDDKPENQENWLKHTQKPVFSLEHPYNRHVKGVHLAPDWQELTDLFFSVVGQVESAYV